nr:MULTISPECIES: cupin domain-containing protein [unclassified Variovorax]
MYRRAESETFEIVTGRYLFEVDGRRFVARRGDLVRVPAGAARAFVNVTGTGARQQVIIEPGIDAVRFFGEVAALLDGKSVDRAALRRFGRRWGVVLLGPSLKVARSEFEGDAA